MLKQIKFTSNPHGKLFLNFFQDARLIDTGKYFIGNRLEVLLNKNVLGIVEVVAVRPFKYGNINDTFSYLNCGRHAAYQAALLEKYYVHELDGGKMKYETCLQQIVFQYKQRNMELFESLMKDWWQGIVDSQVNYTH